MKFVVFDEENIYIDMYVYIVILDVVLVIEIFK